MSASPTRRTVLLTTLASLGAGATTVRAAEAASVLRIGLSAPNTTMDPHLQSNAPNNAVASHIFDALITNDPQSRSQPGLAESWHVEGDTRWVLKLRQGVNFTDGTPFTAADAIASLQRATDLPSTASFRTYTRSIQTIAAPDPHTLVIDTKGPDPLLANSLSRIRIISAKFKDAATPDFNAGRAAIGTGAFALREYVPGSHVALVRNDAWWGPRLPWSEVTLRIVTDPGARLASLLAGDLDFIEDVPAQGADRVKADPRLHLLRGVSSRLIYFNMDQARDVTPHITGADGKPISPNPLRDLRVRQALNLAINRQALSERVMEGNSLVANQFLPNGGPGTVPDLPPIPYDPARAKALLAEAGFPQGFRLTLHGPNNRYINDARVVQSVAQMFTRIGVETRVEVMPWSVFAGRSAAREFSVALIGWGVNTGETSNPLSALVATPNKPAGLGIANDGGYSNPELDRRLQQALRIMDDTARNALLAEACSLAFRDVAILPLHHEVSVWAARRNLTYATRADQYTLAMGIGQTA
jgi:peptide/nickel transport system substrate-binding protein